DRRRHGDVVADTPDRDHHARPGLLDDLTLEERDHLDPARASASIRDSIRWVRAVATASAASGCAGTPRRRWIRSSASRTCRLSAFPAPVTAIFTSSGPSPR